MRGLPHRAAAHLVHLAGEVRAVAAGNMRYIGDTAANSRCCLLCGGEPGDHVGGGQGDGVLGLHHAQPLAAHHAHVQLGGLQLQAHLQHTVLKYNMY